MTQIPAVARESLAGLAAIFAGALGAFTLTPVSSGNMAFTDWTGPASDVTSFDTTGWQSLQPNTVALGAAVAVPICALLAYVGSRRNAWAVVAACAVAIGGLAVVMPDNSEVATYYYARALAAGVLIGGAVAAAWGRQVAESGLLFGFVGTWLVVWLRDLRHFDDFSLLPEAYTGHAPLWLVIIAVVAAGVAAVTANAGFRASRPTIAVVRLAVVGAIGYALLNRVLGMWISNEGHPAWYVAAAVTALLVAGVVAATHFASSNDARFVLVMVGVSAAATPLANLIDPDPFPIAVVVVSGLATTLLGLRASGFRAHPFAGLLVVASVPLLGVIWPNFGDDAWIVLVVVLLGLGAGHAIGSNLPGESSFAAFGLVVPASSFAITTLYTASRFDVVRYDDSTGWTGAYATYLEIVWEHRRPAALLMLVIVVCCSALVFLRSRRPHRRSASVDR